MTDPDLLHRLGLRPGEAIRFRRGDHGRWIVGRVAGIDQAINQTEAGIAYAGN